jgi:hypothetical protein
MATLHVICGPDAGRQHQQLIATSHLATHQPIAAEKRTSHMVSPSPIELGLE